MAIGGRLYLVCSNRFIERNDHTTWAWHQRSVCQYRAALSECVGRYGGCYQAEPIQNSVLVCHRRHDRRNGRDSHSWFNNDAMCQTRMLHGTCERDRSMLTRANEDHGLIAHREPTCQSRTSTSSRTHTHRGTDLDLASVEHPEPSSKRPW
eukprot:1119808-Rhodomonas_salina.7